MFLGIEIARVYATSVIISIVDVDWHTLRWGIETIPFLDSGYMTVMMVIAFAIILVYLACFFFSKNFKGGWMIAAAVIFSLDTLYLVFIYGVGVDSIMDLLLHAWVLYYLISGSVYGIKLKKLAEDEPIEGKAVEIPTAEENKNDDIRGIAFDVNEVKNGYVFFAYVFKETAGFKLG